MSSPASLPSAKARPLVIAGVDPETGVHYAAYVTKDDLARGFADARRVREDEEP